MRRRSHRGGRPVGLARVTGASMAPVLRDGDLLLVGYGHQVSPGQVVVARFADGTLAVKRAERPCALRSGADGWWLLSDDPTVGVDSRHRGPVAVEDVLGVVLAKLWPRPSSVPAVRRDL